MEFRGVLHVHSTYSDGELTLAELRALGERNGLSFICLAEHDEQLSPERRQEFMNECHARSDEQFRFVPGFEVQQGDAHVLILGGIVRILAHPHRNSFTLPSCEGVEVWNSQYDGKRFPRWAALRWFRTVVRAHPELHAFGGIDLHRASHLGGPSTIVDIPSLTEDHILSALQGGRYRTVGVGCTLDARGTIVSPAPAAVFFGSMVAVWLTASAHVISKIARRVRLYDLPFVRRGREWLRSHF